MRCCTATIDIICGIGAGTDVIVSGDGEIDSQGGAGKEDDADDEQSAAEAPKQVACRIV